MPMTLPSGRSLALVMTDLEGSTVLWERAPEAMAAALQVHHAIARERLARHGGYEIKSEGDSFALAFGDVASALGWCVEVTAALAAQTWAGSLRGLDDRVGLRSRVGVHVGEPLQQRDPVTGRIDLLGPAMNRVARVTAAGHGEQILLSEAAWAAAEAILPALGLEAEDLGLYTLRGLGAPERIRRVFPQGERRRFPPLRATRWRPSSPLAGRDQFVGRAADLAAIDAALRGGARLLTLKGPGGTGKTRLARRYGAEQEAAWPGGVIFCDLTEAETGEAALGVVSRALGLAASATDEAVAAGLQGRGRVLLILDNLEQVAAPAARHLERWLAAPGECALLVTSRVPLRLPGEVIWSVSPLSLPPEGASSPEALLASEAAELFIERASERGAPLTLGSRTCADVAALVRRLDGLPLAIELAAAWARLLSPAAILERVAVHLDPLRRASDGRVPRQATLRAVVGWSWALLSPAERDAFAQLSVFEGGFSVDVAEEVIDLSAHKDAPSPGEIIEALVDHSLLSRPEARGRLSLLVTLQDFAAEQLAARPELRAHVRRRHGLAYAARARRLTRGRLAAGQVAELRPDLDNLVTAARYALEAGDAAIAAATGVAAVQVLSHQGPLSEGLRLAAALAASPAIEGARRVEVTLQLADAQRQAGRGAEARQTLTGVQEELARLDEPMLQTRCHLALGLIEHDARRFEGARAHYLAGLAACSVAEAAGLDAAALRTMLSCVLAHVEREQGWFDEAERVARAALAGCPPDDPGLYRRALLALALLQSDRGRLEEAVDTLRELEARARADADRADEILAGNNLASSLWDLGRFDEALSIARRNLPTVRAMGNPRLLAIHMGNLGEFLLEQGRWEEAEPYLQEAAAVARQAGTREVDAYCRGALGMVLHHRGEAARAWDELEAAAAALAALPSPVELLRLRLRQLQIARETGRPREALLDEAVALHTRLGLDPRSPMSVTLAAERALDRPV